ncbi:hypothetical protein EU538_05860 [Candidatus Thorarchaeota archaeon]|jgi:hypothetical protein|nr:MAG: hypothetical protein EU538_05860 [Candidatus Thorarchaeota archaeon]
MVTETTTLINTLRNQISIENEALEELAELENQAAETAVRLVYLDLRLDTWKHIKFLEGVIDALTVTPCDEWSAKVQRYVDRVKMERKMRSLMSKETSMAKLASEAAEHMDDPIGRFLLEHLAEDEKRHEENLENVISIVKQLPLQSKKGEKGTDIVCPPD